jgi:hypothetical protein
MRDTSKDTNPVSSILNMTHRVHTQSKEMEAWEAMVDYAKLSPMELKVHQRHIAANRASF